MSVAIPLVVVFGFLTWVLRPREKQNNPGGLAIPAAVISVFVIAAAAVIFQLYAKNGGHTGVTDVANVLFIVCLSLTAIAVLTMVVLTVKGRTQAARGTGFGICLDVIICIVTFGLLEWLA